MAVKELMASLEMKDLTKESCKMLSETKLCCQLSCPMKYKLMNSLTLRYTLSCNWIANRLYNLHCNSIL